ncbi:hypothetical protein ABOM_009609 [Aspergillus bombycis]|uniref:Uncharacterized protein n=1 Tax=Aspergillus bombycis TaxID=109264 RepID=A0A1F7ZT22_9EURO|nr:hypothetical protein ABOM_009609 [Aspergillus bombycis]OGM42594.1 hypothetical protein ABOM_009609 [Aspergillus bombycis]
MRLLPLLALLAYLVPCLFVFAAQIPHSEGNQHRSIAIIEARATDQATTATADATTGTTASATGHATATANSTSASNTTTSATTATATLATPAPTGNDTNPIAPGALPLQPTITPALGVGGFLLIVAGAVLAIIGIRNLWIQVFLSTAFLAAIGVTVLIVYVMNPPVRVAVQGAYLVAIFFTAVTFGALSLVFKELTEGLGCLLGGFCSSMWLLSLKPGGLLTQTDSKSGFIGAISVTFYALSFSHYTRPYGLMASTGISGGTAVALGIDCFSRAGWKEFWLYIWALNDDIFPLGTSTYPVTRNIKVELAATVIIAVLGVISQLRLWKVIRERRQKENEVREKEQKEKEEAELEIGRRFEEKNMEERLEWEARHGNPDSGIPELADNSKNGCTADHAVDVEKGGAIDTSSVASSSQESYRCSDCLERRANGESAYAASQSSGDTEDSQSRQLEDTTVGVDTEDQDQSSPDGENVPLKVFDGAAAAKIKDDNSSDMTAIVGSEAGTIRSKRLSGRDLLDKVSAKNSARLISQSQEALVSCDGSSTQDTLDGNSNSASESHSNVAGNHMEEEDRPASNPEDAPIPSVEQEADSKETSGLEKDVEKSVGEPSVYSRGIDEQKFGELEQEGSKQEKKENSPTKEEASERQPPPPTSSSSSSSTQAKDMPEPKVDKQPTEIPQEIEINAETTGPADQNDDKPRAVGSSVNGSAPKDQDEKPVGVSQSKESSSKETPPKTNESAPVKQRSSKSGSETKTKLKKEAPPRLDIETVKRLPQRTSKVVQSYRTNEWAKHLDDAEAPEPEPIESVEEEEPETPDEVKEAAAPVKVEELLQTPLNAQPPPAVERRVSIAEPPITKEISQMANGSQLQSSARAHKRAFSGPAVFPETKIDHSAHPGTQGQPVQGVTDAANTYDAVSPTVDSGEQPCEEAEVARPQWKGPPPLIAVREGMMRNRLSSFSFSADPWASRFVQGSEVSPRQSTFPIPEEADDMPLSRRRTMLHQQMAVQSGVGQTSVRRSTPTPLNTPSSLAAWRESVRENVYDRRRLAAQTPPMTSQGTGERNPTSSKKLRGRASSVKFENAIAEGMQRGDMTDLHREALRRMQAMANRNRPACVAHPFGVAFLLSAIFTTTALPVTVSPPPPPSRLSYILDSSPVSETASFAAPRDPPLISPPEAEKSSLPPRRRSPRRSWESHQPASSSAYHSKPTSSSRSIPRHKGFWTPSAILRPPSVRLANPVNYVPRITPVTVPHPFQGSEENLCLEAHRDAYPLLSIPEQRRSRLTPSPNSLVVERSQGETESGRSSIAVPRAQRRSGTFNEDWPLQEMPESAGNHGSPEAQSIRPPDRAHLTLEPVVDRSNPLDDRPRHIQSQTSLRSQAQIASIPSHTGQHPGGEADVAEELAWGPAHPCYPHINPHVSVRSREYHTTRIIRIRRDWMVRGDLAPTFSNLYPEILDPLLPEQEFRRIIATVNDKLVKAFDPFSLRNWIDGALALLTGWIWEDIGVTGVKNQLKQIEDWVENWNHEVGAKDGVYIWSLRRTGYMSLDIQIPDPKVGIIPSEHGPSLPGTRPSSGVV